MNNANVYEQKSDAVVHDESALNIVFQKKLATIFKVQLLINYWIINSLI